MAFKSVSQKSIDIEVKRLNALIAEQAKTWSYARTRFGWFTFGHSKRLIKIETKWGVRLRGDNALSFDEERLIKNRETSKGYRYSCKCEYRKVARSRGPEMQSLEMHHRVSQSISVHIPRIGYRSSRARRFHSLPTSSPARSLADPSRRIIN